MILVEVLPKFLDELAWGQNCSAQTVRAYGVDLGQFIEFLETYLARPAAQIDADDIDHRIVRAFLSERARQGTGRNSLGRKLSSLRSFYAWLMRVEGARANPARLLKTPRTGERTPAHLTRGETVSLLDAPFAQTPLGRRNRAILELMYAAGLRVGEVVAVDLDDFDLEEGWLRVRHGKGGKEREVLFGAAARAALADWLAVRKTLLGADRQQPALFLNRSGGRLTTRSVARMLKIRLMETGLRLGYSPHALRHTFATHMLNNGADIRSLQELLGHASLSTTQRYTQVSVEELMRTYQDCHPRAKKGKG